MTKRLARGVSDQWAKKNTKYQLLAFIFVQTPVIFLFLFVTGKLSPVCRREREQAVQREGSSSPSPLPAGAGNSAWGISSKKKKKKPPLACLVISKQWKGEVKLRKCSLDERDPRGGDKEQPSVNSTAFILAQNVTKGILKGGNNCAILGRFKDLWYYFFFAVYFHSCVFLPAQDMLWFCNSCKGLRLVWGEFNISSHEKTWNWDISVALSLEEEVFGSEREEKFRCKYFPGWTMLCLINTHFTFSDGL